MASDQNKQFNILWWLESCSQMGMNLQQWKGFIVTCITAQFFVGMLANYAILKPQIGGEFNFSESFLGLAQMLSMFMRVVGTVYLLTAKRTKFVYFVCTIVQVLFYALISLGHYWPQQSATLFIVGMMGQGVARGSFAFPYILAYDAINGRENKLQINIWSGLFPMGTAWAVLLASWMLNGFGWGWVLTLLAYDLIFLLTGVLAFFSINEVDMPQSGDTCESVKFVCQFFFQRKMSNMLVLFDFMFQQTMIFIIIYWMPYYFTLINFKTSSIYILIVIPIFSSIGSFIFNLMINKCCPSSNSIITSALMVLHFVAFLAMCFLGTDPEDVFLYFVLLALGSAFLALPYSKSCSTEISDRVQNSKENYIVINGMKIFREVQVALYAVIISIAIEAKPIYFLYFVALNAFLNTIIHIAKRIVEMKENNEQNQGQIIRNEEQQ